LLNQAGFEPPVQLRQVSELALQHRFEQELQEQRSSLDLAGYGRALEIAEEVARWNYRIDKSQGNSILSDLITQAAKAAVEEPSPERVEAAIRAVRLARALTLEPNLDLAQEAVHAALVNGARGAGDLARLAAALNLSPQIVR
jgi:hypothetical protein